MSWDETESQQHTPSKNPNDEFVRNLAESKFNYWAGYVANISLIIWLFSRAFSSGSLTISGWQFLACLVGGYLLYTLTEYGFHRFLYHEWQSMFSKGHGLHHDNPKGLLGLPWYIPYPVIIGAFYGLAYLFSSPASVGVLMAGWWSGFVFYCALHHSCHHFNFKNKWFRKVKAHHKVHHVKEQSNFGVVTTVWDRVFGTYFEKA